MKRLKKTLNDMLQLFLSMMILVLSTNITASEFCDQPWQSIEINHTLNRVIWGGSQFVAIGEQGAILTSPNGMNWTEQNSNISETLNAITWTGSSYVIVGDNGTILSSLDGKSWDNYSLTLPNLNDIVWNGQQFLAVGDFGTIVKSLDSLSWSIVQTIDPDPQGTRWVVDRKIDNLKTIVWDGNQYTVTTQYEWLSAGILYASTSYILTSQNGHIWKREASLSGLINKLVWNGEILLGVGGSNGGKVTESFSDQKIYIRKDFNNWSSVLYQYEADRELYALGFLDITWHETHFIAVGRNGDIYSSEDGQIWVEQSTENLGNLRGIGSNTNQIIAVGVNTILSQTCLNQAEVTKLPHYRLYNHDRLQHYFTTSEAERNELMALGWQNEGWSYYLLDQAYANTSPLYRLYSSDLDKYYWTANARKREELENEGWVQENIDGYIFNQAIDNTVALYHLKHEKGNDIWTSSLAEYSNIWHLNWTIKEVVGYVTIEEKPEHQQVKELVKKLYSYYRDCNNYELYKTTRAYCSAPYSTTYNTNCLLIANKIQRSTSDLASQSETLTSRLDFIFHTDISNPLFKDITDEEFIEKTYWVFLGRSGESIDNTEKQMLLNRLAFSTSRREIIEFFRNHEQFKELIDKLGILP